MIRALHAQIYVAHMIPTLLISSAAFRQSDGESAGSGSSAEWTRSSAHVTIQGNSWWLACMSSPFLSLTPPSIAPILNVEVSVCKSQTNFAQSLVEREGEKAQGSSRHPLKMPFTFSLNNILSIVSDRLSKKALLAIYPFLGQRNYN
jgi:hypothetical protein